MYLKQQMWTYFKHSGLKKKKKTKCLYLKGGGGQGNNIVTSRQFWVVVYKIGITFNLQ